MKLVREVPVASHVKDYAVRLVMATHPKTETASPIASQYLRFGSSPRGGQTLLLGGKVRALTQGRFNVSFDDIEAVALAALRHRLILNFEAEAEAVTTDHIIAQVLQDVPRDVEARLAHGRQLTCSPGWTLSAWAALPSRSAISSSPSLPMRTSSSPDSAWP